MVAAYTIVIFIDLVLVFSTRCHKSPYIKSSGYLNENSSKENSSRSIVVVISSGYIIGSLNIERNKLKILFVWRVRVLNNSGKVGAQEVATVKFSSTTVYVKILSVRSWIRM